MLLADGIQRLVPAPVVASVLIWLGSTFFSSVSACFSLVVSNVAMPHSSVCCVFSVATSVCGPTQGFDENYKFRTKNPKQEVARSLKIYRAPPLSGEDFRDTENKSNHLIVIISATVAALSRGASRARMHRRLYISKHRIH